MAAANVPCGAAPGPVSHAPRSSSSVAGLPGALSPCSRPARPSCARSPHARADSRRPGASMQQHPRTRAACAATVADVAQLAAPLSLPLLEVAVLAGACVAAAAAADTPPPAERQDAHGARRAPQVGGGSARAGPAHGVRDGRDAVAQRAQRCRPAASAAAAAAPRRPRRGRADGAACAGGARVLQLGGDVKQLYYYPRDTVLVSVAAPKLRRALWEQAGVQAGVPVSTHEAARLAGLPFQARPRAVGLKPCP